MELITGARPFRALHHETEKDHQSTSKAHAKVLHILMVLGQSAGDRVVVATDTGDILVIEGTELKLTLSSGLEGAALHCMVHYQKVYRRPWPSILCQQGFFTLGLESDACQLSVTADQQDPAFACGTMTRGRHNPLVPCSTLGASAALEGPGRLPSCSVDS